MIPTRLSAYTADKIAATVFLNRFMTLRTRLRMNRNPINRFRFISAFLSPKFPHYTRTRGMSFT
ncbi:hypothetical protein HanPSC8_Chr03g0106731 [Helianthus annuus]|nr:hypothetical protein HanPSC8_Chr03g0106731 [Helianthus annuus]